MVSGALNERAISFWNMSYKKLIRCLILTAFTFAAHIAQAKVQLLTQYIAPVANPTWEAAVIKGEYGTGKGIEYQTYAQIINGGYYHNYCITIGGTAYWAFDTWRGFLSCPKTYIRSVLYHVPSPSPVMSPASRYLYPLSPAPKTAIYNGSLNSSDELENQAILSGWDANTRDAAYVQRCHTDWKYTISFNANGGMGTMSAQEIINSGNLTVNRFTRTGYSFAGWECNGVFYSDGARIEPSDDMTLSARWTPNEYTIKCSVDSPGGGSVSGDGAYPYDSTAVLTARPNTGWLFDSWSPGGSTSPELSFTVKGDATYTAKFKQITYRLAFHPNSPDATGSMPTNTYTYGTQNTLPPNRYVRAGYDFKGWALAQGSNWNFADEAQFSVPGTIFSGANPGELRILYAYWDRHIYTVALDRDGGSGGTSSVSAYSGDPMPNISAPSRTGYVFSGYYSGKNGTGVKYYNADGTSAKIFDHGQNITLYAAWTAKTCTVTFKPNGGNAPSFETKSVTYDAAYGDLPDITRNDSVSGGRTTYYTFNGWFKNSSGVGQVLPETTVDQVDNHNLYASWTATTTANVYKVTFNPCGGDVSISSMNVTYDSNYGELPTPSRTGYKFNGWYTAESGGSQITSVTSVRTVGNHVLYAQWVAHEYTIKFDGNDHTSGSMYDQRFLKFDSPYSLSANQFKKSGSSFMGWSLSKGGPVAFEDRQTVKNLTSENEGIVTLYAVWGAKQVTVTFDANEGNAPIPSTKSVTYGEKYGELPPVTRDEVNVDGYTTHYTFSGWFSSRSGGERITSDMTVTDEEDHVLYAQWASVTTGNVYTVTLDPAGGVVVPSTICVTNGEAYAALVAPEKPGYRFVGWHNSLSNLVENTTIVSTSSNHVLYAHWGTYSLTLDAKEGSFTGGHTFTNIPCILGEKYPANMTIPSRSGYVFAGWWTNEGVQKTANDDIEEGALELAARWKLQPENSATVKVKFTFDNGKDEAVTREVPAGSPLRSIAPDNVVHADNEKYIFVGWFSSGLYVDPDTPVEQEQNLVARWSEREYNEFFGYDDMIFSSGENPWVVAGDKIQSADLSSYYSAKSVLNVQFLKKGELSFNWEAYTSQDPFGANHFRYFISGSQDWLLKAEGVANDVYKCDVEPNLQYEFSFIKDFSGEERDIASISDFRWVKKSAVQIDFWDSAVELKQEPTNAIFETGGATNWVVVSDVVDAGENAIAITNLAASRSSWARMTVSGAGELRFKWKVSCEGGYVDTTGSYRKCDYLEFCDGDKQIKFIDGEAGYVEVVYTNAVNTTHVFTWRYVKDGSGTAGKDAAYIDSVVWTPVEIVNPEPGESDRPVISGMTTSADGGLSLTISNASSLYDYELIWTDELLTPPEDWLVIEKKSGVDGPLEFSDFAKPEEPTMFFRVRVIRK